MPHTVGGDGTKHMDAIPPNLPERGLNWTPTGILPLATRLPMDGTHFKTNENKAIQSVLSSYNQRVSSISAMSLEGECQWKRKGTWEGPWEQKLEFTRKGFELQSTCGERHREVRNGLAFFSETTSPDFEDSFYLYPLVLYDPGDFASITGTTLELKHETTDSTISVDVYKLEAPTRTLYLSKDKLQLIRVDLCDKGQCYARIDCSGSIERDGLSYPSQIQISYFDKSHFLGPRYVPESNKLCVHPDSLRLTVSTPPDGALSNK
jgi:hypothetical protein